MSANQRPLPSLEVPYQELIGLRLALTEIRHRLERLGVSEAVEHLQITDIAITQTLLDIRSGVPIAFPQAAARARRAPKRERAAD